MYEILPKLCTSDGTQGTIVMQSLYGPTEGASAIKELQGMQVRRDALTKASSMGLASPGINGSPRIFPVDTDGKEVTRPTEQDTATWYCEVPVTARLV